MDDEALKNNALAYLNKMYGRSVPAQPKALFNVLRSDLWSVTNRTLLVQFIATATALVISQGASPRFLNLVADHCRKNRKTDLARLVIEALLTAHDFDAATSKKLSTWASAVRYLVNQRTPPSRIETLSQSPGEGVDAWARRNAHPRKVPTAKLTPAQITISVGKNAERWTINDGRKLARIRAELIRLQSAESTD